MWQVKHLNGFTLVSGTDLVSQRRLAAVRDEPNVCSHTLARWQSPAKINTLLYEDNLGTGYVEQLTSKNVPFQVLIPGKGLPTIRAEHHPYGGEEGTKRRIVNEGLQQQRLNEVTSLAMLGGLTT